VSLLNANIANISSSGIDFRLDYRFETGSLGKFSYFLAGTYLIENTTKSSPVVPGGRLRRLHRRRKLRQRQPDLRFTQRLTWDLEPVQVSLRHRFIGSAKDGRIAAAIASGAARPLLAVPETGDVHYFDLSAFVNVTDKVTLFGTIDNLLDKNPPYQLFERETYDAIGRRFSVGFKATF
jgi:iron complex outermembrane receptor protein